MQRLRRARGSNIAAIAVVLCGIGFLRDGRAETLSWAQVKERAKTRSPAALGGKQAVRAARADAEGAGRWPRTNPMLHGSVETGAPFGDSADLGLAIGIEQELDLAGVAATAARAARRQIIAAENEAAVLRLDGLADAMDAFIDLDRAQRSLAIWTELDKTFHAIASATARAAGSGERSELDAILAEADSVGATTDVAQARSELARAQARLSVIVASNDPASLKIASDDTVPEPDQRTAAELAQIASRRRPEISLWRARRDEAEARRAFAARSVVPQPTVGVGLRWARSQEGRDAFVGDPGGLTGLRDVSRTLELTLSIPLPLFDRNQAERARAIADMSTAGEQTDRAAREVRSSVMRAKAAVDASWSALSRFRAVEPRLAQAQALLEKGFAAGQVNLFDMLAGAERVARARIRAIEARATYLKARAELRRAIGEEP